jgi:hypothetical protein
MSSIDAIILIYIRTCISDVAFALLPAVEYEILGVMPL